MKKIAVYIAVPLITIALIVASIVIWNMKKQDVRLLTDGNEEIQLEELLSAEIAEPVAVFVDSADGYGDESYAEPEIEPFSWDEVDFIKSNIDEWVEPEAVG